MKFHVFGLLLCIIISVHGNPGCTSNEPDFIEGYQHFPGIGHYKLYTVKLSWSDAWKQCKDDGAYLVVINNKEEYEKVMEMLSTTGSYGLHVGIHDLFKTGIYLTLTGEDFVNFEYPKWDVNEPNHLKNNEYCVMLRKNGLLNDIPCSTRKEYFICEHKQDQSHLLAPRF